MSRTLVITTGLGAAAGLLYALFLPDALSQWDPLQFALALEHTDMATHQPHPPGYIGFVGLAWLLKGLGLASGPAVLYAGLLTSAAAVPSLWLVGRRLHGERAAWLGAAFFATNPVTWYHAVSGESYAAEALFGTLIILLGLRVERDAPRRDLAVFFAVYGLAGAFRQNLPVFFLPYAAWRLWIACRHRTPRDAVARVAIAGVAGVAGVLAWAVPLLAWAGGLRTVILLFGREAFDTFGREYSFLFGADSAGVLANLDLLARFTVPAIGPAALVACALLPWARRRLAPARTDVALYACWMGPPFLWFVLVFVMKAGHLLQVAAPLALLAAVVVARALDRTPRWAVTALPACVCLAQAGLFLAPPDVWTRTFGYNNLETIEYDDALARDWTHAIERLGGGEPDSVLIVSHLARFGFRHAEYHLPDHRVLWLMDAASTGMPTTGKDVCAARSFRVTCAESEGFWLRHDLPARIDWHVPYGVRRIAWLVMPGTRVLRDVQRNANPGSVRVGASPPLLVSEVGDGPFSLEIDGFRLWR